MNNEIQYVDNVVERVKFSGFGDQFASQIRQEIAEGKREIYPTTSEQFPLPKKDQESKAPGQETTADPKSTMEYKLEIKVNEDKAFYNGFRGTFTDKDGTQRSQWFPANEKITKREAANMLVSDKNPRPVLKHYKDDNNNQVGVWMQINFSAKTENNNHVVRRIPEDKERLNYHILDQFSFKETVHDYQKRDTWSQMQKGRSVEVTPETASEHKTVFLVANPLRSTITIEDKEGNFLKHDQFRSPDGKKLHEEKLQSQISGQGQERQQGTNNNDIQRNQAAQGTANGDDLEISRKQNPSERQFREETNNRMSRG